MKTLWTNFIYEPIYNALIYIAQNLTMQDVGLAVIVVTVIIRFIIMPLSKKSIESQYKMKALEPKLAAIKAEGLSKEEEAKRTFELYKSEKMNPFSGCLYILIQLPILLALYFVFAGGIDQPAHLYRALSTEGLSALFLGMIDITKPFIPFAILAGITQAAQAFLVPTPTSTTGSGFQQQFTKSLSVQTKYVLPIIVVVISIKLAAAVALYWSISNLFSIGQELYFRNTLRKKLA